MFDSEASALCDLMEGLFHIAMADGTYHPAEDAFLRRVAEILGLDDRRFSSLKARFVPGAEADPYDVLDVAVDASDAEVPVCLARGGARIPPRSDDGARRSAEAIKLAEGRMQAINRAWETIRAERGL